MTARRLALVFAAAMAVPAAAFAQASPEDKDLGLIPGAPAPIAATAHAGTYYVENALTFAGERGGVAPAPPGGGPQPWLDRLFVDANVTAPLSPGLSATVSGRANFRAEDDIDFPARENFRLDLREAYLSWALADGYYLDLGRVNLKSGVALGYNPTDFFKTRAVVDVVSSDPSALRENRLGAVMLRGQAVLSRLSLTMAWAPRLAHQTALYANLDLPVFDPMLDRSNAHDRFLLKANVKLTDSFSPEAMVYQEGDRTRFGVNLTEAVGRSVVVYAEWAGGREGDLITEAMAYGHATGTIPPGAQQPLPSDPGQGFRNDLSLGASYTTPSRIVLNLEYHYHQAGLGRGDWDRWFAAGRAPALARPLWYIRGYASDRGEPASRQTAFLRFDWTDAWVRKLNLNGFANVDLYDGSALTEIAADYLVSDRLTVGAIATANLGGRRTDFGSLAQGSSLLLKVARYF